MHAVIVMRESYYRFVEGLAAEVVRRGGRVTLIARDGDAPGRWSEGQLPVGVTLEAGHLTHLWFAGLLRYTRELRSYLHWLGLRVQPQFLLDRWLGYIPRPVRFVLALARRAGLEPVLTSRLVSRLLAWLEAATPPGPEIVDQLRALQPDLLLLTPLLYPQAWEIDYLKAGRRLGLPHAALVASWDNLTSKGIFHVRPDLVLVWNEIQVQEAVRYHAFPPEAVAAVGAPVFDRIFARDLMQNREAFCAEAGLNPNAPYVVYAVSSAINCGDETDIVRNLRRQLEAAAPGKFQLLVKPHPNAYSDWAGFFEPGIQVSARPAKNRPAIRRQLWNILYHSAAVVGLNTTVFLEAAILDRPGLTLLLNDAGRAPSYHKHTQLPHFDYLVQGGFLEVARDEKECAEKIGEIARGRDEKKEARRAFVRSFLRPAGIEAPASQIAVDLLEQRATASQPLQSAAERDRALVSAC